MSPVARVWRWWPSGTGDRAGDASGGTATSRSRLGADGGPARHVARVVLRLGVRGGGGAAGGPVARRSRPGRLLCFRRSVRHRLVGVDQLFALRRPVRRGPSPGSVGAAVGHARCRGGGSGADDGVTADSGVLAAVFAAMFSLLAGLYAHAWRTEPAARELCRWLVAGSAVGASCWLASLAVPAPGRFWLWAAAVVANAAISGPIAHARRSAHPHQVSHMPERASDCSPSSCWARASSPS